MDDLERDRQVGCGEEQNLKKAKPVVLAMARMVRSLDFVLILTKKSPKLSFYMEHPSQVRLNSGPSECRASGSLRGIQVMFATVAYNGCIYSMCFVISVFRLYVPLAIFI